MSKELMNPPNLLKYNPFNKKSKKYKQSGICAVIPINSKKYKLKSFRSKKQLPKNAFVTHYGKCGACSSLQDLEIYKKKRNLTGPVKSCTLRGMISKKWNQNCIASLGFSKPCAQIWFFDSQNALKKCWKPCLKDYFSSYNAGKDKLNSCLQCDEIVNGPTFKKFAGRTRRNSGIKSAIKRKHLSKLPKRRIRSRTRKKSRSPKSRRVRKSRLCQEKKKNEKMRNDLRRMRALAFYKGSSGRLRRRRSRAKKI